MSAAEEDTELRDLLIQNLENSGALNKLKAELRAAVFLAMEDQDRLENKSPLVNDSLRKCLSTKDGSVAVSLIVDFLQVFNLDFSLAVFQPETNQLGDVEDRDQVCRDLDLGDSDLNRSCPLLLELVHRRRTRDPQRANTTVLAEEPSQKQADLLRRKFDFYDKDGRGTVLRGDVKNVFADMFPAVRISMLETFVSEELRAADSDDAEAVDFQQVLGLYRCLFSLCRTVVVQDPDRSPSPSPADRSGFPPVAKDPQRFLCRSEANILQQQQQQEEDDEGDSFFDDPLPKPQKTYGGGVFRDSSERIGSHNDGVPLVEDSPVPSVPLRRGESLNERTDQSRSRSEVHRPEPGAGGSWSEQSRSNKESRGKPSRSQSNKSGSLHLDEDVEYDDDFNSHRSDLSRSDLSLGEEIEEVSIEGPDHSDKLDESTQDVSVSQISQSHGADYMEDVS
ncbi:centrosomal protein 43 isoform 3-T3 [Pholidichthys leucotaenia]